MLGLIIKGIDGFYYVKSSNAVYECKARGKFRFSGLSPMIGDKVDISVKNGSGNIEKIYERSNFLIRPAVSNVSQAFIVFSVKNPEINTELLNKLMLMCDYKKLHIVICFNKIDLDGNFLNTEIYKMARSTGYDVALISAKKDPDLTELKCILKDNVTVLCGPSGAGKSTLINNLSGRNVMETANISEKIKRGKNTTRHSELIDAGGGFLIDTPGFSSMNLDFVTKDNLQCYFPEFKSYIGTCRFTGCFHYKEPDCSIKEAVLNGDIHKIRYDFYVKILEGCLKRRNTK